MNIDKRLSNQATRNPFYSRKEKSLSVLCTKFLKLYDQDGTKSIGLDDAAFQLGVERRRIYDIVNILESVGVLQRKAKNQYTWIGFAGIPQTLERLKEEEYQEKFEVLVGSGPNGKGCEPLSKSETNSQDVYTESNKADSRKEKSLALLTQNFIRLFLGSNVELISLDYVASALIGDTHKPTKTASAKTRRLYDIANVLATINLIEKTREPVGGKPAFRWIGTEQTHKPGSSTLPDSERRLFGTDITNTEPKTCNTNSNPFIDRKVNNTRSFVGKSSENDYDFEDGEDEQKGACSKGFVYGPFSPASVSGLVPNGNETLRQVQDWESLASTYRPQYRNKDMNDLFNHYVKTWELWYDEAVQDKQNHAS